MPQFDFANVFVPQLFWLAVFFSVLYFGIVRPTLPKLGRVMDERTGKIEGDLAQAQAAKAAADDLTSTYTAELERNCEAARGALAEAKAAAAVAREQRVTAADAETDARLADAEARIATARDQARASLRDVAVESAQAIVTRLTGATPSPDAAAGAVSAAMARA